MIDGTEATHGIGGRTVSEFVNWDMLGRLCCKRFAVRLSVSKYATVAAFYFVFFPYCCPWRQFPCHRSTGVCWGSVGSWTDESGPVHLELAQILGCCSCDQSDFANASNKMLVTILLSRVSPVAAFGSHRSRAGLLQRAPEVPINPP